MVQGKNVPSWNEVTVDDLGTIIDGILAETVSPEKVDRDALVHVLQHAQSPKMVAPVSYQAELYKVIGEEYEKLILDDQGIEKTLENMQTRTQEIIDHNQ